MISDPKKQIVDINKTFAKELTVKYDKGQREHGGNFYAKPTVSNIREEVVDLVAYTHVLEKHKDKVVQDLCELWDKLKEAKCKKELLDRLSVIITNTKYI
jgi:hypothetical protein